VNPFLSRVVAPCLTFSMLFVVASCGSSPSEVVAIEVDNSLSVDTTPADTSTITTQATTTSTPSLDLVTTTAPISQTTVAQVPPTQSPATQAPATPAPPTQPPATQAPVTPPPAPSDPVGLRIEPEFVGGYDRDLFADWYDADRNGCNTRKEVLIAESLEPVQIGAR